MEQSKTESGQSHLSLIFNNENVLPLESFVLTVNNQPRVQVNFTLFAKCHSYLANKKWEDHLTRSRTNNQNTCYGT